MNSEMCEVRECKEILNLDTHHIHSQSKGGPNKSWNKCKICPNCHRKVHTGELIIEGRFETTYGNTIVYRKKDEESITGFNDPPVWLYSDLKEDNSYVQNFSS